METNINGRVINSIDSECQRQNPRVINSWQADEPLKTEHALAGCCSYCRHCLQKKGKHASKGQFHIQGLVPICELILLLIWQLAALDGLDRQTTRDPIVAHLWEQSAHNVFPCVAVAEIEVIIFNHFRSLCWLPHYKNTLVKILQMYAIHAHPFTFLIQKCV